MKVTFDREGAAIIGTEMTLIPRQADWTEVGLAGLILDRKPAENLGNVDLLELTKNRTYVAQSGLVVAISRIIRISTSLSVSSSAWGMPTSSTWSLRQPREA